MLTPLKSIRAKCLDCSCGSFTEVEHCPIERCPIYPYRFGKNPNTKNRELTPARKAALEKALLARGITVKTVTPDENPATEGTDTTPPISHKKTAPGEATTQDGKTEQIERTDSAPILPHRKDIVKA